MTTTVKSREVQRGMLAEMRGEREAAARHFLAAAHLELVLAGDYEEAGRDDLALRSRLSAASCLWRAGDMDRARSMLRALAKRPQHRAVAAETLKDLEKHYPE
jgi:hypothetical protein